jgi:hypothetical protein
MPKNPQIQPQQIQHLAKTQQKVIMSERTEAIRQKFLRRLHRAVFQSVPNNAAREVDLSRLRKNSQSHPQTTLEPDQSPEFSFEWQDSPTQTLKQR